MFTFKSLLRSPRGLLCALFAAVASLATLPVAALTAAPPPSVVISQVYGGGGNSGATYTNDFIELFNPTGNTEIGAPLSYSLLSTGNPLPEPVEITAATWRTRTIPVPAPCGDVGGLSAPACEGLAGDPHGAEQTGYHRRAGD